MLDYARRLEQVGVLPSMSRGGCPYDNAKAESFMKTLKTEEVDGSAYSDLDHARSCVGDFIEQVYNRTRLHSALDYRSPMEFEDQTIWAGVRHGYGDSALNAANPLSFDQSRCAAP